MDGPRTDRPRTNRDPDELERKRGLLSRPAIAPLAKHVNEIRADRSADRVPDFDPTEAGIDARVLLLLEAPGAKTTRERGGSGFVSPDNNDGTAENMWQLLAEARRREGHETSARTRIIRRAPRPRDRSIAAPQNRRAPRRLTTKPWPALLEQRIPVVRDAQVTPLRLIDFP